MLKSAVAIQLRHEIEVTRDAAERRDVTSTGELTRRTAALDELASHAAAVTAHKGALVRRLRDPYLGDCVDLEPEYHEPLAGLFRCAVEGVNALPRHLRNLHREPHAPACIADGTLVGAIGFNTVVSQLTIVHIFRIHACPLPPHSLPRTQTAPRGSTASDVHCGT